MNLVIFDCDGVLVDSELLACREIARQMGELGCPIAPAEVVRMLVGRRQSDGLALIEARLGRKVPADYWAVRRARTHAVFAAELRAIGGVRDAIELIPHARCVASSSSHERLRLTLGLTGLAPLFEGRVFSGEEVRHGKPAPDLFLHAAARMGARPARCLVVEDSVPGVEAAVAANMPVVGFTGGAHADDGLAERLRAAGAAPVIAHMDALPPVVAAAFA